jgi:hypothetical protein
VSCLAHPEISTPDPIWLNRVTPLPETSWRVVGNRAEEAMAC